MFDIPVRIMEFVPAPYRAYITLQTLIYILNKYRVLKMHICGVKYERGKYFRNRARILVRFFYDDGTFGDCSLSEYAFEWITSNFAISKFDMPLKKLDWREVGF
jgi:hypothetical protein